MSRSFKTIALTGKYRDPRVGDSMLSLARHLAAIIRRDHGRDAGQRPRHASEAQQDHHREHGAADPSARPHGDESRPARGPVFRRRGRG